MNNNILHWSYRDFRDFPAGLLEHRESVQEVYLKENFIPSIPEWLFEFTNLRFIHLGGNMLQAIPDGICLLRNLEFLDVSRNQIKELPHTFSRMTKLNRFNCSDNRIKEISKGGCRGALIIFMKEIESRKCFLPLTRHWKNGESRNIGLQQKFTNKNSQRISQLHTFE